MWYLRDLYDIWGIYVIFKGSTLLLMGSADKLPEKPTEQVTFVEDLSENEAAAVSNHFTLPKKPY